MSISSINNSSNFSWAFSSICVLFLFLNHSDGIFENGFFLFNGFTQHFAHVYELESVHVMLIELIILWQLFIERCLHVNNFQKDDLPKGRLFDCDLEWLQFFLFIEIS